LYEYYILVLYEYYILEHKKTPLLEGFVLLVFRTLQ